MWFLPDRLLASTSASRAISAVAELPVFCCRCRNSTLSEDVRTMPQMRRKSCVCRLNGKQNHLRLQERFNSRRFSFSILGGNLWENRTRRTKWNQERPDGQKAAVGRALRQRQENMMRQLCAELMPRTYTADLVLHHWQSVTNSAENKVQLK